MPYLHNVCACLCRHASTCSLRCVASLPFLPRLLSSLDLYRCYLHCVSCFFGFIPSGLFRLAILLCPPQPCTPGTYNPDAGRSACTPCKAGSYCSRAGATEVTAECPAGSYCPEGSVFPTPCPIGSFAADRGNAECPPCPGRSYCNTPGLQAPAGLCEEGYACVRGAPSARPSNGVYGTTGNEGYGACPPGFYCPAGTADPIPCAPGTYQVIERETDGERPEGRGGFWYIKTSPGQQGSPGKRGTQKAHDRKQPGLESPSKTSESF